MHRVVVVAYDGVVPFDLSVPAEGFARVRLADGSPGYRLRVAGVDPLVDAGGFAISTRYDLSELRRADTVILPGVADVDAPVDPRLVRAIQRAHARGARVASICSGAFVLAATGLLDGRRATTHWLAAPELARRYPAVRVDPDVLYVDEGRILTSAGAAAGLDLCLHIIRRDLGAAVAAESARFAVMPLERTGGQSQFIRHALPASDGSLEPLLRWMEENLHRALDLADIARRAGLSVRSLSRHFAAQTGTTPRQWLVHARVRRAQELLEATSTPVERIAEQVGFASASLLREHFRRLTSTSPKAYRRAFRREPGTSPARPRSRASGGRRRRAAARR
jgi:transcriptional regulator GlxA family with amidase domain